MSKTMNKTTTDEDGRLVLGAHRLPRLRQGIWAAALIIAAGLTVGACSMSDSDSAGRAGDTDDGGSADGGENGTDDGSNGGEDPETGPAEVIGEALADFAQPDPALGATAPLIVAENYEGERVELGGDGIARVIGFFAHWCPHCQAELPRLVEWLDDIAVPEGVEVVAIATAVDSKEDNYPPSEWFEREGYDGILLRDSSDYALATGYGLRGFPYWVVVGADGRVVNRITGTINAEIYEAMLAQAAAGSAADR